MSAADSFVRALLGDRAGNPPSSNLAAQQKAEIEKWAIIKAANTKAE
jgi:hypothetical protein